MHQLSSKGFLELWFRPLFLEFAPANALNATVEIINSILGVLQCFNITRSVINDKFKRGLEHINATSFKPQTYRTLEPFYDSQLLI